MAKKRFTFADAKIKIQQLEEINKELAETLNEELSKDEVVLDNPRTGILAGLAGLAIGLIIGGLLF